MSTVLRTARLWPWLLLGTVLMAIAGVVGLSWGSGDVGLMDALRGDALAEAIVWQIRMPRVVMAAIVGAVLALSGALLQALLRNPLASPFTLGVAGGGSLGAFTVICLEGTAIVGTLEGAGAIGARAAGAFIGVMLSLIFIFAVARAAGGVHTVTLLLAGVTLNFLCAAGTMLLQLIADFTQTMSMVRWAMGGLEVTADQILPTALIVLVGLVITLPALRHLDVMSLDDATAHHLGVPVRRVRLLVILGCAFMVGACLAVAGPISFIGLMVPHITRLLVGTRHRALLPVSALLGATLLIIADALGRSLPSHLLGRAGEIPVGVLTAALGGPFFLFLLVRGRRGGIWGGLDR